MTDFDLLPFIKTIDGSPCMPLNIGLICMITAVIFNYVYNNSVQLMPSDKSKAARVPGLLHAVHATLSSVYIIHFHFPSPIQAYPSSICNEIGPTKYVFAVSMGYFLWDLFICFKEKWGIDWKIHAIFCVAMYGLSMCYHALYRWGTLVLFYELSTVFLHSYAFLYWFEYKWLADKFK